MSSSYRYKIIVEYDGRAFSGWQRQKDSPSIQGTIEKAIKAFSGEDVTLHVAGRTDAGVHALAQVAHFDLTKQYEPHVVKNAINAHLRPCAIAIITAEEMPLDFHARFSAQKRYYCYRFISARAAPLILHEGRAWRIHQTLDLSAMQKAANYLLGTHDFSSFRDSQCQAKSPIRTLERCEWVTPDDPFLSEGIRYDFYVEAKSFLHHQIRNIVGSLYKVGLGEWSAEDIKTILDAKDRTKAGITAPAEGLYFLKVDY